MARNVLSGGSASRQLGFGARTHAPRLDRGIIVIAAAAACVLACDRRPATESLAVPDAAPVVATAEKVAPAPPHPIRMVSWNVNAGRGDQDQQLPFVRSQLGEWADAHVFALSEVERTWFETIFDEAASTRPLETRLGTTGANMRLAIAVDASRLEVLEWEELGDVGGSERARDPLAVTLRDRFSGLEFRLVTVHLIRGNAEQRRGEAARLREWMLASDLPTIAIGDFNMDCPVGRGAEACDASFADLVGDEGVAWFPARKPQDTTCNGDRADMLDLVFASGPAQQWPLRTGTRTNPEFCSEMATGAHFPIVVELARPRE